VRRFTGLARAFTLFLLEETEAPMNEISFLAWACGGVLPPFAQGRGEELKEQLVRATIEGTEAVWAVSPEARIFHIDPICNIVGDPNKPEDCAAAAD
jgi:hypothetical protein